MPISSALLTRFFQLVTNRQFAEAERELQRLKQRIQKTEWNRGYYRALYGIMLARKTNNDQYAFLSNLNLNDKHALQSYRREFMEHVKSRLHTDYDRGFFSAWADYMRVLLKTELNTMEVSETQQKIVKGQTSISQFLGSVKK